MEGIDAAHEIKARAPGIGVLILSQYADEAYAFELFRNGTAGLAYLLKDRVAYLAQLLSALREVAAGGSVIDPQVVEALVQRAGPAARIAAGPAHPAGSSTCCARWHRDAATRASPRRCSCPSPRWRSTSTRSSAKLDLASEQQVHRRVAAVLTFLRDAGLRTPG